MMQNQNPTSNSENDLLTIDLSDLAIEEIELFTQESSRGIPDFAASSSGTCDDCCRQSCVET